MKIAFIYPPFHPKLFNENLSFVDEHFGCFPNLGLAYASAVARQWGAEVRIWDAIALNLSREQVLKEVQEFSPDLLAFTVHAVTTFWDMMPWMEYLKQNTGLPVLIGGHEVPAYLAEIMSHPVIDYAVQGEALLYLPPFLDAFSKQSGYSQLQGFARRERGELKAAPLREERLPFDRYPFPARDLLPNDKYFSHVSQRKNFTIIMSSVGCPFGCSFCALSKSGFSARSVESVLAEMKECYERYGIREFDFFDPLMLYDRQRAIDLARGIKQAGWDIFWSCRSRVDVVDEKLLEELAESGCVRIFYGIESASPTVLKKMKKGIDPARVKRVIAKSAEVGIRPLGFFQIGAPGENRETVKETVKFALSLPLDYAQFLRTIAKPNSELEEQVNQLLGYDYWREYVKGKAPEMRLPAPWTELSPREVEKLTQWAYLKFYTRPRYALKMLSRLRSWSELARYLRVGFKMMGFKGSQE